MPVSPFSYHVVAQIAAAVLRAADLRAGFEILASELFQTLSTRAMVLRRGDSGWVAVAGAIDDQERRWETGLMALCSGSSSWVKLDDPESGPATAVSIAGPDGAQVAVVLEGDWTSVHDALSTFALVTAFALHAVFQRDEKRAAQRYLRRGYALMRWLSRSASVEGVAQQLVDHVARLLGADRVSLAMFSKTEEALAIVATHGYPRTQVEKVRIAPGVWAMGHVFASGRPLFVRDVRQVSGMARDIDQYQTYSFAAVPIVAGSETVGVLAVTDKRDGSAFGPRDEMILRGISAGAGLALLAARSNTEAAKLVYAATIDSLTGLLNRPNLDSRLHQEVERCRRESAPLAVLMADIDDFKRINDTLGHQVGDTVLQVTGGIIRSAVRVFDVCARYGGDEFAVIMPNCDEKSALACAERIRARITEYRGEHGGGVLPPLTMSVGVAVIEPHDAAPDLIRRADVCLYQAKADGKNLVRTSPASERRQVAPRAAAGAAPDRAVPPGDAAGFAEGPPARHLPYVLVADADQARAALCLEAIKPFKVGLLIAHSGTQATQLIDRFGPPILLIADLKLSGKDGFTVIETLPRGGGSRTEIIAWAPSREIREYASARIRGLKARVLSGTAPAATIRAAIERALRDHAGLAADNSHADGGPENDLQETMSVLSEKARRLCGAPGIAVYMKMPGDAKFRASFSWISNELAPHSPYYLPRVFNEIRDTGDTVLLQDLTVSRLQQEPPPVIVDAVRGLAGVPIIVDGEVAGAICVFDVKPLDLTGASIAALEALGRDPYSRRARVLPSDAEGDAPSWLRGQPAAFRGRADDRSGATATPGTRQAAIVDWPPSLLERSGGEFAVAREIARARREGRQLSAVLFDVSPVSTEPAEVPDRGDSHLDDVAETLLRTIRQSDLPIRWSVSELLLVLPGLGGQEARTVAERVRAALQAGSRHRLAVSGGVAELENSERFNEVVDRARQKVALAVGRGHNRVI